MQYTSEIVHSVKKHIHPKHTTMLHHR